MEDVDILRELEPEAERLLNRHLATAEVWYPHEHVPWERASKLTSEGFTHGEAPLSPGARSALLVNLLTEDNLPWYTRTISRMFGANSAWGAWAQRWTAEEGRHAILMRDYITVSGLVDPKVLEEGRMAQVSSAIVPEPESAADGMCYVAIQELATRISHRNTGTQLNDPAGYNVMMKLSSDENRHHLFYRDLVSKFIELNPSAAVEALKRQVTGFAMPGVGIPGFVEHAKAIASAGIFDFSIHHERIIMPLVFRQWAVDKIEGLSSAAEEARVGLFHYIDRVAKVARRQAERFAESQAINTAKL